MSSDFANETLQTETTEVVEFTAEEIARWREDIRTRREQLFRKGWKNARPVVPITSRKQEQNFDFVLGWYEESAEELLRNRERIRLDGLLERGLDVNDPANRKK